MTKPATKKPRLHLSDAQKTEIARLHEQFGRRKTRRILMAKATKNASAAKLAGLRDGKAFPKPFAISLTAIWNVAQKTTVPAAKKVEPVVESPVAPEPVTPVETPATVAPVAQPETPAEKVA